MKVQIRYPIMETNECNPIDALEEQILQTLKGRIQSLRVISTSGGLRMTGRVRSYYDKQLAQHVLMQSTQQPLLQNNIEVLH